MSRAHWRRTAIAGVALFAAGTAAACGHCVEDRIAAVYDHALVQRAKASGHRIAYFAWEGALARDEPTRRRLIALAETAAGVDKGSARVSMDPAAIAVAFDPRTTSGAAVAAGLQLPLRRVGLQLMPLQAPATP